ncbi:MAG TPA: hypothetical protein VJ808_10420 [Gemmatimonadales bacterium]|nr:hypothetical protein [Gemmatimonadales bacterium]
MPKKNPAPAVPSSNGSAHPLADRVQARVAEVGLALDQRARASRPRSKRPRSQAPSSAPTPQAAPPTREASSLRRVFNELAVTHRQFRLRSGQHASQGLREAARAFKDSPSLPSLVVVAAFLEEDGLLEW